MIFCSQDTILLVFCNCMPTFTGGHPPSVCGVHKRALSLLCAQAQRIQEYMVINGRDVYILVALSSMLALSYNIVHSLMILHTSAVATTVIGEAKIIGLLILSYFILGELA